MHLAEQRARARIDLVPQQLAGIELRDAVTGRRPRSARRTRGRRSGRSLRARPRPRARHRRTTPPASAFASFDATAARAADSRARVRHRARARPPPGRAGRARARAAPPTSTSRGPTPSPAVQQARDDRASVRGAAPQCSQSTWLRMRAPKLASRSRSRLAVTSPSGRSAIASAGRSGRAHAHSSALRSSAWRARAALPQREQVGGPRACASRTARQLAGSVKRRLGRLDHVDVALPALVLELDVSGSRPRWRSRRGRAAPGIPRPSSGYTL